MCSNSLYYFVRHISHSTEKWTRYYHTRTSVYMSSTLYSCPILMRLEFFWQFFEKYSNINFKKIISVGDELFHADGQTDMTKLTVAFRNFANAPKNCMLYTLSKMNRWTANYNLLQQTIGMQLNRILPAIKIQSLTSHLSHKFRQLIPVPIPTYY